MELVSINQLRPGQVVASAVTNSGGAVLCPMGYTLTEDAIRRLGNAGVEAVIIEGTVPKGPDIEKRVNALNERFAGIEDPIMLQLKATIENRLNFMRL